MTATKNQALITARTDALAIAMGISDQQSGMTTPEKLLNMADRHNRLHARFGTAGALEAATNCLALATIFDRSH